MCHGIHVPGCPLYHVGCQYDKMRLIVQIQVQPDDHMFSAVIKTQHYFSKDRESIRRMKTAVEYKTETGMLSQDFRNISNHFSCLEDLVRLYLGTMVAINQEDVQTFLNLLKWILHCILRAIAPVKLGVNVSSQ